MGTKAEELRKKLAEQEEAFRKKQKQLKARLQLESAKERKARDKMETHVKIIAGAIAFEVAEQDATLQKKMEQYLQGYLEDRPGDWPYFDKFPAKKDGGLLFKLREPKGWQEVARERRSNKDKPSSDKEAK